MWAARKFCEIVVTHRALLHRDIGESHVPRKGRANVLVPGGTSWGSNLECIALTCMQPHKFSCRPNDGISMLPANFESRWWKFVVWFQLRHFFCSNAKDLLLSRNAHNCTGCAENVFGISERHIQLYVNIMLISYGSSSPLCLSNLDWSVSNV